MSRDSIPAGRRRLWWAGKGGAASAGPRSGGGGAGGPGGPRPWASHRPAPNAAAFATWCSRPSPSNRATATRSSSTSSSAPAAPYRPEPWRHLPHAADARGARARARRRARGPQGLRHHRRRPADSRRTARVVDEFYARFSDEQPWVSYAEDFAELMKRVGKLMHDLPQRRPPRPHVARDHARHSPRARRGARKSTTLERPAR